MGELAGPDIAVLVLAVGHAMGGQVGASFLVNLEVDSLSVPHLVVELELCG